MKIEKIVKRRRGGNIIQLYSFKSCETAAGSQSSASVEWKPLVVDGGKCEVVLKKLCNIIFPFAAVVFFLLGLYMHALRSEK